MEVDTRYDDVCTIGTRCNVTLDVTDKMEKPVYFYYKLTNYYQNHRLYVKSRNDDQLRGHDVSTYSSITVRIGW